MTQAIRHRHAEGLLLSSERSIAEIAGYSGFRTAKDFSASFKKRIGPSPSAFRDKSKRGR